MFLFIFFLMIRRPPRSTRTDTLFPYTTLFRSLVRAMRITSLPPTEPTRSAPSLAKVTGTPPTAALRSEEHTSELQSLMRISYAVFCLKKNKTERQQQTNETLKVHLRHMQEQRNIKSSNMTIQHDNYDDTK